ncbi:poly(ADP-ribose) glycohydrolase-like isoform X3 [Pieris napi]|uniref:poly(ADP-ribose) glycohydrolase-like isoform X3 n=1 Tax=Pieris napi TaxID=78633 RepID=UPI001FB88F5F|nr:poly(ADP-ribose) glycohydrolase-like isoform X3 [Pieris napi]
MIRIIVLYIKRKVSFRNKMVSRAMSVDHSWRGIPLSQIYGSDSPWGSPEFPLVQPAFNHAVLHHILHNGDMERPPKPHIGTDKWDQDHVRMPCSRQSLYPITDDSGCKILKERWAIIEETLSKPIKNVRDLAAAIITYNTKFKDIWTFSSLHYLFDEYLEEEETKYFFNVTLPQMAKLALDLPKLIQTAIPLLKQRENHSISLSQQQVSSLLANAFFCTFPRRNSRRTSAEYANYPFINYSNLFNLMPKEHVLEKLKSICHYFRRVCSKVPTGVITFSRRSVPPKHCPDWENSSVSLATLPVHVDSEVIIEDLPGLIQVDFANKFLGGGVLRGGCVQEEIRFVICPELMLSMLFTEVLAANETLIIIGSERYSEYTGYGSTFHWSGDHIDSTPFDSSGRRRCAVLAMDAIPYTVRSNQWKKASMIRDLNKAWVGFSSYTIAEPGLQYPGIATGNWGCGAFGGTATLKSLVQMMSCAQAQRPMAYCTFHDTELRDYIERAWAMFTKHHVTVGQLFRMLLKYCDTCNVEETTLLSFFEQEFGEQPVAKDNISIDDSQSSKLDEVLLQTSPDLFSDDKEDSVEADSLTISQSMRLFSEMEKIDANSGTLNLTGPRGDEMDVAVSPDIKKRVSKKITDYFAKKS